MDKLKKIFSPGSGKDDEVLYGDAEARQSVHPEGKDATVSPDAKLATNDTVKDHSIVRQILNPGGEHYDSVAYGRNASVVGAEEHQKIQNDPARQSDSGGVMRQILNPNQEKYDPVIHGAGQSSTSGAGPAAAASSAATTQRSEYAQPSHSGSAVAGTGSSTTGEQTAQTDSHLGRDAAVAGGVGAAGAGAYAATQREHEPKSSTDPSTSTKTTTHTTSTTAPSTQSQSAYQSTPQQSTYQSTPQQSTYQSTPQQSTYQSTPQQSNDSHLGRDAAIVGGVGAAGAGTYAATQHHNNPTEASTESRITDRAHPLGSKATDSQVNPTSTTTSTYQSTPSSSSRPDESHLGRDAAIAGGVGAAGAGAYGASQYNQAHDGSKITERPHPLSNKAGEAHVNPISAPEQPETQAGNQTYLAGAGAGSGTHNTDADQAIGTRSGQLNQAPADVQSATYTERAVPLGAGFHHSAGPHVTDTANRLDPHVPGEFPTEQGLDRHGVNPAYTGQPSSGATGAGVAGATGAGAGAAAYGLSNKETSRPEQSTAAAVHPGGQDYPAAPTTSSSAYSQAPGSQPTSQHHYGRDAAIAGGAGAAGVGAYEATKSHPTAGSASQTSSGPASQTTSGLASQSASGPTSQTVAPHQSNLANTADPRVQSDSQQQGTSSGHHYGRDAAIVGGTGAAGAAAYGATQGRGDTGPASKTIGPHDSNVANVVDPRVQPNPSQMKDSTTTGPHQSNLANRADPRVDSDASKADQGTSSGHHYGRDAAVGAGAVGAAGAAGYGAEHLIDEKDQKKLEKEHKAEQKEAEKQEKQHQKEVAKEEKAHQKEVAKEEKAHQKEAEKQEKAHQKEVAKAEKQHEKEVAKEEKAQQKEVEKMQKQHEKEMAKQEKQHEKEAAKEEKKQEKEAAKEEKKHEKELAAAGVGAGAVGAGAYEAEKHHQGHEGASSSEHAGRSSYDTNETSGSGGEKKRGLLDKILHPTRKSEDDNRVAADDDGHNKLHKKHVPKEHETSSSSPLAGGSGTTYGQQGSGLAGQQGDGLVAGPEYPASREGVVTEPHTGLPMNVGQYGSGAGGTDGAQQISGYHPHSAAGTGAGAEQGLAQTHPTTGAEGGAATGPDWNAIKKENTPY